jgi:hypothetical protein
MAVTVDRSRFDRVMACTCHALVYHQTGNKLRVDFTVFTPGIVYPNLERDESEAVLAFSMRQALKGRPQVGENPDVFWYQFVREDQLTAMRLEFYGGFSVYAVADERASASPER